MIFEEIKTLKLRKKIKSNIRDLIFLNIHTASILNIIITINYYLTGRLREDN